MIYLLDTSGLVRLLSDPSLQSAWYDAIDAESIASCSPQRAEFLSSARDGREYDEIAEMFGDLYPDVAVPKNAGRWIGSVQHRMAKAGAHRSASAVDLTIAATAAHHGLTVLHDDADYRTIARHAPDLKEQSVRDALGYTAPVGSQDDEDDEDTVTA
ncbi:PIN domain-containing protein [Streptomyces laurentii]|uniref:PIN domain-containing protein n=1 Tax=Streptomyces laurentii TaxID=39478 RepID=UPI0036B93191